ncbi:alpha/beta fold hydrolase [soil metagenome]
MKRIRLFALLLAGFPGALHAQGPEDPGLEGTWTGAWGLGADTLGVTMRFESGEPWVGSFDSERLRIEGIPFTEVAFEPPRARIRMEGDATTIVMEGLVEGDSLSGTLREEEAIGWFAFRRGAPPVPALREEDVRFRNGEVELAGTLILPPGEGPHAAVVFTHGSGAEGRWAARYLARRITREGFAALIWDKRGVGESGGQWSEAGFEDQAGDAAAAVVLLRARPEIDPGKVGIHGHSQGGTIGPLAAVRARADFLIASAASGLPMADVEVYSVGNFVGISTLPPDEAALARAYVEALVDVAYRGGPRAELDAAAARARGHAWFFEPPAPDDSYWAFSRRIADFDPLVWWRQVDRPVLLLYGSEDGRVPVEPSRRAIVATIESAGKARVDVRIFEGGDHTYRLRRPGDAWPRTVQGYPEAIVEWLRGL